MRYDCDASGCRRGTVVAIAPATHAADDAARVEEVLVVLARVRAALVGVMQEPEVGAPALQGHLKRLDGQVAVIDGTERPADDERRCCMNTRCG